MMTSVALGVAISRDSSGNPVDIWGNRTSVPGRVAPTVITYPSQIPAQGNQPPVVITVNPPLSLVTPPITRKNILAMPQGVTNDTLTKLIGLNDNIKNANIYQTLKISSRSV